MRVNRLLQVTYLSVFVVCLPLSASAGEPDDSAKPAQLKVVRTWQDLLDALPVAIDDPAAKPVTARLGISAIDGPVGGGVVIYCLTEGYALPERWTQINRLGPLLVEVRHESERLETETQAALIAGANPPDLRRSTPVFLRAVPLHQPGKYSIRIRSLQNKLLATATVTAKATDYHPWIPLEPSNARQARVDQDQIDAVGFVVNRARGMAIPQFDGMAPLLFRSDGPGRKVRHAANQRLPALIPAPMDPRLTIRATGTDLLIQSPVTIIVARADWHLLARWWINGKPFRPQPLRALADQNGQVIEGKTLLLKLDFRPERFSVKPGDRVELQLLYCKQGWQWVQQEVEMLHAPHLTDESPQLLLSNRLRLDWNSR